jgi:hypothetical protein
MSDATKPWRKPTLIEWLLVLAGVAALIGLFAPSISKVHRVNFQGKSNWYWRDVLDGTEDPKQRETAVLALSTILRTGSKRDRQTVLSSIPIGRGEERFRPLVPALVECYRQEQNADTQPWLFNTINRLDPGTAQGLKPGP